MFSASKTGVTVGLIRPLTLFARLESYLYPEFMGPSGSSPDCPITSWNVRGYRERAWAVSMLYHRDGI